VSNVATENIHVKLPDGSERELPAGSSAWDLAKAIGPGLAKAATGAKINGQVKSLPTPLSDGDEVAILTFDTREGQDVFNHSAAHLMASAIQHLRPGTKFAIGPAIEDGFYYDIECEPPLREDEFPAIEAEMAKIAKAGRYV
jgi:threonyl-tRNA synthetase